MDYDLLVIGEERNGIDRAIEIAQHGRRVAIIGATESVPSLDCLRLAIINLNEQSGVTMASWRAEVARLTRCQTLADNAELEGLGIERIVGNAKFVTPTCVEVAVRDERRIVTGKEIVLACGSRSRRLMSLGGHDRFVVSVESLLNLRDIPRSIIVVGAGESGLSAAMMLADLGVEVIVVDEHATLLELCGMFDSTFDAVQSLNVAFRLDDAVIGTELRPDLEAAVKLASGRTLVADAVLVCVGREGRTDGLNLEAIGVGVDERGRVWCNDNGQTWVPPISAVGDLVGFRREIDRSATDDYAARFSSLPPRWSVIQNEPRIHNSKSA